MRLFWLCSVKEGYALIALISNDIVVSLGTVKRGKAGSGDLAKVGVEGSNPFARSNRTSQKGPRETVALLLFSPPDETVSFPFPERSAL